MVIAGVPAVRADTVAIEGTLLLEDQATTAVALDVPLLRIDAAGRSEGGRLSPSGPGLLWGVSGEIDVDAVADVALQIGLDGRTAASLPFRVEVDLPASAAAGTALELPTRVVWLEGGSFDCPAPAGLEIHAGLQLGASSLARSCAGSCLDAAPLFPAFRFDVPSFATLIRDSTSGDVEDLGDFLDFPLALAGELRAPRLAASATVPTLECVGYDNFARLEFDLESWAQEVAAAPLLLSDTKLLGSAEADFRIVSGSVLVLGMAWHEARVEPELRLRASGDADAEAAVGDALRVTMPADGSPLDLAFQLSVAARLDVELGAGILVASDHALGTLGLRSPPVCLGSGCSAFDDPGIDEIHVAVTAAAGDRDALAASTELLPTGACADGALDTATCRLLRSGFEQSPLGDWAPALERAQRTLSEFTVDGPVAAIAAAGDRDGDGVVDPLDSCPSEPNPPGPGGTQPDADGNGIGDACECGDASGNGRIDSIDARLIQRCAVGAIPCLGLCDASGDGRCDSLDARLVQRVAVGAFEAAFLRCSARPD